MKPIGRTKRIPYCKTCADLLLIPSVDIARFGVYYEQLSKPLQRAVEDYYHNKGLSVSCFNKLVDEFNAEYEYAVEDYEETYADERKLLEEVLLQNG
jgi:hypothetical protein